MRTATIVKDRQNGMIHIRIGKEPQTGGTVDLIEVLQQRDDESLEEFKERCIRFVKERVT
jgi:hypothetical protein